MLADGDAVPGDGGVGLGEQPLARAPGVAEHGGATGLLVGLHPSEALARGAGGCVAQHQEVHPDVGGPPVPLGAEKVQIKDDEQERGEA